MSSTANESRVILALQAFKDDKNLNVLTTTKIYNVNRMTLARRRASIPAQHDTISKSHRFINSEKKAIVQYILELVIRVFPPRLRGIKDIANQLLRIRDAPPIGKL